MSNPGPPAHATDRSVPRAVSGQVGGARSIERPPEPFAGWRLLPTMPSSRAKLLAALDEAALAPEVVAWIADCRGRSMIEVLLVPRREKGGVGQ